MLGLHAYMISFPFRLRMGSLSGYELGCLGYSSCRPVASPIGDLAATQVSPPANLELQYLPIFLFECMLSFLNVPALILCVWFQVLH